MGKPSAKCIGSTKALIEYAKVSPVNTFIIATEAGILYKMRELVPEKKLIPAPALETNSCACSECPYMKMNTLEKVFNALYYELPEITLSADIISKASVAMTCADKMDSLSNSANNNFSILGSRNLHLFNFTYLLMK
jgi:quinolinate synthase